VIWGSTAVHLNNHVLIFGYRENGLDGLDAKRTMVLARAPAERLHDVAAWQFRTSDDWKNNASEAVDLCADIATEYSISALPNSAGWMLVTHDAFLSPDIVVRTAPTPWGPWSTKRTVFRCPENARHPDVFTYAAKHHPHLDTPTHFVISYAANASHLSTVLNDTSLYMPRFVRVPWTAVIEGVPPGK